MAWEWVAPVATAVASIAVGVGGVFFTWLTGKQGREHAVVGEAPVGDVGLPELVGLVGGEAFPGRAGPFVGLGRDESAFVQDAPDR